MPLPRSVTIDGPAGSGKSSVSFQVARDLGYLFVDTGAFYRMVTLAAVEAECADADEQTVLALARTLQMNLTADLNDDGRQYTALLNGHDVTHAIRGPEVEAHVSAISAMPHIRALVTLLQRDIGQHNKVLMVGRDIGTVVLPDADLKIYLDATPEARGKRRYLQNIEAGKPADLEKITEDLRARDAIDSTRQTAPLRKADDAIYLDSSDMGFEEVITHIRQIILDWPNNQQVLPNTTPAKS